MPAVPTTSSGITDNSLLVPQLPTAQRPVVHWGQLYGCADSLAINAAAQEHNGPILLVVADMPAAQRLTNELGYFAATTDSTIQCFPDWETLPYDVFSPLPEIVSQRLLALYHLPQLTREILITPVTTLLSRLPPPSFIEGSALILNCGDRLDLDAMRRRLEASGYVCCPQVNENGEFAIRGSLLDLFPMGSDTPFRIDLFDDEIESIKRFDIETQRSTDSLEGIHLLPGHEFPTDEAAITRFRQGFRQQFDVNPADSLIYREVSNGSMPGGIEYYQPLFHEQMATLFDYLPDNTLVIRYHDVEDAAEALLIQSQERYEQRSGDHERPPLPPELLMMSPADLSSHLHQRGGVVIQNVEITGTVEHASSNFGSSGPPPLPVDPRTEIPTNILCRYVKQQNARTLFVADSAGRREALLELLRGTDLRPVVVNSWKQFLNSSESVCIGLAPIDEGLVSHRPEIRIIAESQLFGERVRQKRRRKSASRDAEQVIRNLSELHIGAPVVHEQHGVGRYLGLQKLTVGGMEAEFLTVQYAKQDKLYVPVVSLNLISRYSGASPENAPLHRLGGDQWQKIRKRANERVRDVAAELLEIYAKRQTARGLSFDSSMEEYARFASTFPFEETPDQQNAIEDVLADMQREQPMDRVVCGDVGFGKTEVALRAAFVAVQNNVQVAILVPTTLLAKQHLETFRDRLADWPIRVEGLSRFQKGKEASSTLKGITEGKVDIVIGTHKLLSDGMKFARLGLVIIDEEHRFGVRHKEKLKKLRAEVDLLTLTATPLPRTLNMGMASLRDLSIIATPPAHRHPIKTFITEWNDSLIVEGCLREIKRGGQVYFLHNEVRTIDKMADELKLLVPGANVRVAHGQLREHELESVMQDFYHQRFNILVCSTIIESGIDVPTANTILINRADKLGLAQLHQLRGRVGRSHHRAYAYLLIPPRKLITADAGKRLEAIESMEDLGAGFVLATHDLEIRGAGELLGEEQSGQIHEIGFTLYMELLERTVAALKSGQQPELDVPDAPGLEIDLQVPALIPDDYMPDVHNRLVLYKRIAAATSSGELRELQVELIDRFGLLPEPAKNLFRVSELKLKAAPLGIRKIEAGCEDGRILFAPNPNIALDKLLAVVHANPSHYNLGRGERLKFTRHMPDIQTRVDTIEQLCITMTP
ncbi:MAG TPA: transcription-repair coupling factor [Chromatiales bacterium]|nr:transcription-repair coupling factor [Chromatiales bacterium]